MNPHLSANLDESAASSEPPAHARGVAGFDVSSAIYGSLLVTAVVTLQLRSDQPATLVGLTVLISVGVFWLTDVWAGLLGLGVRGQVTRDEIVEVAREESPMLLTALPPVLALGLAPAGVLSTEQALDLAVIVAIAELFLWGLAVGRAMARGWLLAVLVGLVDLALGLLIVGLKIAVLH